MAGERSLWRRKWGEWFWISFPKPGLPVRFPALRTDRFRWRGIYGAQIGPWFVGAIHGQAEAMTARPAPSSTGDVRR